MSTNQDRKFMTAALTLGRRAMGRVWPNPAVGCVVAKNGVVVGRAFTADGGRPHAETQALAQAGGAAAGATAYVTLEPCAHHGKTGPCAEALVAAGVSRVVVATTDPDPRVAGKGLAILRDAGIEVELGICKEQADRDHAGFFKRIVSGRPFVTLKLASSLDGRIATSTGESQWITGGLARHAVHAMRARHDAVMVGAGTARADDPSLNVREMGNVPQPVRIVVTKDLNIPTEGKLAKTAGEQPVWLLHGGGGSTAHWAGLGVKTLDAGLKDGAVDLAVGLQSLGSEGLTRVFCEGGGALAGALLKHGLVDELVVFTAGLAMGADGIPSLGPMGIEALSAAPRFELASVRPIGADTLSVWRQAT